MALDAVEEQIVVEEPPARLEQIVDRAVAGEDFRVVAQIVQHDCRHRQIKRPADGAGPAGIGQIAHDDAQLAGLGCQPPTRLRQHRLGIILQRDLGLWEQRQQLLGHRAVPGADIEHPGLCLAPERRRREHLAQPRPPHRVARRVLADPLADIVRRMPIVRPRQTAPHHRLHRCSSCSRFCRRQDRDRVGVFDLLIGGLQWDAEAVVGQGGAKQRGDLLVVAGVGERAGQEVRHRVAQFGKAGTRLAEPRGVEQAFQLGER